MGKVACCPNCKSENFKMSEADKGMVICNNCENEFYTLDYLDKKFKNLERWFATSAILSILLLVAGVGLFIMNLYMSEAYRVTNFIKIMERIGLNEAACFVFGIILLSIALLLVYVLFLIRGVMSKVAHSRHFIRKRGFKEKDVEE